MSATQQPAGVEPVGHGSTGWKRRPESGFGKKYVLFGGMRSPAAGDGEDVLDARLAEQEGDVGVSPVDDRDGLVELRRVADPVEPVPVDELHVELALAAADELDDCPRRYATAAERSNGSAARRASASSRFAQGSPLAGASEIGPAARRRGASERRAGPGRPTETTSAMIRAPGGPSSSPSSSVLS